MDPDLDRNYIYVEQKIREPLHFSRTWCYTSGGLAEDSESRDMPYHPPVCPTGVVHVLLPLEVTPHIEGAQWLSGRVLDLRPMGRGFEPHRRHCVVPLSKTHLSLLSTGSTQEDPSRCNWKIVDWDVKNQIKQKTPHIDLDYISFISFRLNNRKSYTWIPLFLVLSIIFVIFIKVFLKNWFKKENLQTTKKHAKIPSMQRVEYSKISNILFLLNPHQNLNDQVFWPQVGRYSD